jgi:uncharacterized repeat protein (TIGR01451 family)
MTKLFQPSKRKRLIAFSSALIFSSFSLQAAQFERISIATGGGEANAESYTSRISADGRYVAFSSAASNLVVNDTNKAIDIFVRDRVNGTTERVSVGTGGIEANAKSEKDLGQFDISGDGRYVVFTSSASNLVADDTNGVHDVFIHDRQTKTTKRVSVDSSGNQGDQASQQARISFDGRYIAFISDASNLVANDTNGVTDAFVNDQIGSTTERVSIDEQFFTSIDGGHYLGVYNPGFGFDAGEIAISANGQVVIFYVRLQLTPAVVAYDRTTKITDQVNFKTDGEQESAGEPFAVSSDGNSVLMKWNEFSGTSRCAIRDRTNAITSAACVDSNEKPMDPFLTTFDMSANGNFVAFANDLEILDNFGFLVNDGAAIVRRNKVKGITEMVSKYPKKQDIYGNYEYFNWTETNPAISADGRFISYTTNSDEIVSNDTNNVRDIYLRDMNMSSTVTPTGKPKADLVVTQTDSSDPIQFGTNLTYSLTITNQGPFDASNVKLIDTLPSKGKLVSATPSQGVCTGKSKVTCKLAGLTNGASATVQLVVTPQINKKGKTYTLQNMATASATTKDPNTKNNKSIKEKTVVVP